MSHRRERVGDEIRAELSALMLRGLKGRRLGFVTVTEVSMSGDLRRADVHVSVFGSAEEQDETLEALRDSRAFIRREIGHRLGLRFAPEFTFHKDDSMERGSRIDRLLHDAGADAPDNPDSEDDE